MPYKIQWTQCLGSDNRLQGFHSKKTNINIWGDQVQLQIVWLLSETVARSFDVYEQVNHSYNFQTIHSKYYSIVANINVTTTQNRTTNSLYFCDKFFIKMSENGHDQLLKHKANGVYAPTTEHLVSVNLVEQSTCV